MVSTTTEFESTREEVLMDMQKCLNEVEQAVLQLQLDYTACRIDQERWPPRGYSVANALTAFDNVRKRYENIISLHRMPSDHGDAAIRRALTKIGFRHMAGADNYELLYYWNGSTTTDVEIEYVGDLSLEHLHIRCRQPDSNTIAWELINPTAGEVVDKLGLRLPVE